MLYADCFPDVYKRQPPPHASFRFTVKLTAFIIWVLSCPDISVVSCEFFFGLKFLKFVLEISTELSRFNYRSRCV